MKKPRKYRVTGRAIDDTGEVINLGSIEVVASSKLDAWKLGHDQLWDERLNIRAAHVVKRLKGKEGK